MKLTPSTLLAALLLVGSAVGGTLVYAGPRLPEPCRWNGCTGSVFCKCKDYHGQIGDLCHNCGHSIFKHW